MDADRSMQDELRITCADAVELVTEYLDDALSEADREAFTAHLGGCEACAVYVDQIRQTVSLTSASRTTSVGVPEELVDRLVAAFERAAGGAEEAGADDL